MKQPKAHPLADCYRIDPADIETLAADIAANGQRQPILLLPTGEIIDGRTRFAACIKAGVEPKTVVYEGPTDNAALDALVRSLNDHRRHSSKSARACAGARRADFLGLPMGSGGKRGNQHTGGKTDKSALARADLLKDLNIGDDYLRMARDLLAHAPESLAKVEEGKDTIPSAFNTLELMRQVEREQAEKNSLETLRAKSPALAEEVETGRLTHQQAELQLLKAKEAEAAAALKAATAAKERLDALARSHGGLAASMNTINDIMAKLSDDDVKALLGDRHDWQREKDLRQATDAIKCLTRFQKLVSQFK
jgi:hypothetical protein